ncbi:MAG: peptidase inhibitor family I36 protein [Micromonosporaceae bacterium]
MSRSRIVSVLVLAVSAAVAALVPAPATAAESVILIPSGAGRAGCPGGYVCLWEYDNFRGRGVGFYYSTEYYGNLSSTYAWINNWSESAYNNGNTSDVRFGRFSKLRGGTFVLCRKDWLSHFPNARDEGATTPTDDDDTRPGYRWRNQISSHQFFSSNWC